MIVLNKADVKVGLRPEDVVTAIKCDIAVNIPNSRTVPASINRGVPIMLDDPRGAVSAAIRDLADTHLRGPRKDGAETPAPAPRRPQDALQESAMSLADRLDSARRSQPVPMSEATGGPPGSAAKRHVVDPFGEVKERVHQALIESLGPRLYDPHLPEAELAAQVRQTLQATIDSEQTPLSHADRARIAQEVSDEILGHGPLEPLLRDPEVTEIMVNGPDSIYVERAGKLHPVAIRFASEAHLRRVIDKIVGRVGRRVDEASPLVDARLPDGSRVNAVISPIALDGAMLTIRKFSKDPFNDADLIAFGTFSPVVATSCGLRARPSQHCHLRWHRAGKTTTLNVIS